MAVGWNEEHGRGVSSWWGVADSVKSANQESQETNGLLFHDQLPRLLKSKEINVRD